MLNDLPHFSNIDPKTIHASDKPNLFFFVSAVEFASFLGCYYVFAFVISSLIVYF